MVKTKLILLCGGNSKRFNSNKLLYNLDGKPLYRHTLDKLISIVERNSDMYVCVVSQYKQITDYVDCLHNEKVLSVYNEDCKLGASYSIKYALTNHINFEGYNCFFVSDQPYTKEETIESFIKEGISNNKLTACVTFENDLLNPVMFSTSLDGELLSLTGDQGGKKVLKKHLDDCYLFQIDDASQLRDIDTINDLEQLANN